MKTILLVSVFLVGTKWASTNIQESCLSKIYCQGPILDHVQRARLFPDSKTFVDMKMLQPPNATLEDFDKLLTETKQKPTKIQLREFVKSHFKLGQEFESWTPLDFNPNPRFLDTIKDSIVKDYAKELVSIWPQLSRKIKQEVFDKPEQFSIVPLPNSFIIPGGRFREIYYWDSYWIVKGLLISEMTKTVKGMLENFLYLINQYGFIPNGSRVYYLNRSQPPLFVPMVADYIKATNDIDWLRRNIHTIEAEINFWIRQRTINITKDGETYQLAHYDSKSPTPRPESYLEDMFTAGYHKDEDRKQKCYMQLKSGAESGWDFSSRWIFDEEGGHNANLSYIDTKRVIPVDLNAFLCGNFKLLKEFYDKLGVSENAKYWNQKHEEWKIAIEEVLYNDHDGIWYDYDVKLGRQRRVFYASNLTPLWSKAIDLNKSKQIADKVVDYLMKQKIDEFAGGIPASLELTGEQWDLPNAWPPIQSIVVFGLEQSGSERARDLAKDFAMKYLAATLKGYKITQAMYEKYDALHAGQYGGGGEYRVQEGFGWTNGVALEFIDYYYSGK